MLFNKVPIEILARLRIIIDSIGRIGDYSINISEITINASINSM